MNPESQVLYESRFRMKTQGFLPMTVMLFVIAAGLAVLLLLDNILCRMAGYVVFGSSFLDYIGQVDLQTHDGMVYNIAVCVVHVLTVLLVIFLRPFYSSFRRTAFLNARGHRIDNREILSCVLSHERFMRSVHLGFNILLRILTCLVLSMLPAIACLFIGGHYLCNEIIWNCGIALGVLSVLGTALFGIRYLFADYFTFVGEKDPDTALKKSVHFFKANRKSIYCLLLNLWGYILLSFLIFPIPWSLSYIEQSLAVCTKWKLSAACRYQWDKSYNPN